MTRSRRFRLLQVVAPEGWRLAPEAYCLFRPTNASQAQQTFTLSYAFRVRYFCNRW